MSSSRNITNRCAPPKQFTIALLSNASCTCRPSKIAKFHHIEK
ncbi:hypothetical protein (plasmid) [Vibrio vulnificus YJ016]|uniref:Uncharacterized protein n=1 Tax=Vibrio vulnificus (strain YJ016) TaxID=196600 RepID=Q7MBJ8_VIBVY|nr:hypothetical protein [Vibrio vulnificus YJ016]